MGRQVLTGISPLAFERCNALPSNCNITAEDVVKSLPSGTTLEGEIKVNLKNVTSSEKHFKISISPFICCRKDLKWLVLER